MEPEPSPDEIAAVVRGATDEELQAGLDANRELLLAELFRRMPERLRADRGAGLDAVVEWRVTGRPGGGADRWQLTIHDGRCSLERDGDATPTVAFTIGPLDMLRLASGGANPTKLFVLGRLRVEGDLMLAVRLPGLFAVPRSGGR